MPEKILTKNYSNNINLQDLFKDLKMIIDNNNDIKFDKASKLMYSTDASIYQIEPLCIIFPKTKLQIKKIVEIANKYNVSIVPRGAGTSLAGQAINNGIMIDFSKYMNQVVEINADEQWTRVQPGIVIAELNKILKDYGLHYAIDTSTKNRATIGGGIGNNSCGTHSIIYGKTIDQVIEIDMVLSDGKLTTFKKLTNEEIEEKKKNTDLEANIYKKFYKIVQKYHTEILNNFPKIDRRVSGYNLDSYTAEMHTGNSKELAKTIIQDEKNIDLTKIIVGSEGTLGIITEAKVKLVKLPKYKGLVVSTYGSIIDAAKMTNYLLEYEPAAIEMVDKNIIHGCIENPGFKHLVDFLDGKPEAMLICEFFAETQEELSSILEKVSKNLADLNKTEQILKLITDADQNNIWKMRQAGLGLLMNVKGDAKPLAFVEDTAVHPNDLPNFLDEFQQIITSHNTTAGFYGHASVGCIHIRPMINIKNNNEIKKMQSIADQVADLVLKYGGSLSGEHGDGILRGIYTEKMFGKKLTNAFREIKNLFDSNNLMNPGKIIDTPKFTSNLKIAPTRKMFNPNTTLDFTEEGGFQALVEQCNGQGACRKFEGVMCPSYMATMDEQHSTRGRANLIRELLTNQTDSQALLDPKLIDALDLCIGCKACKTECPSQVDMAKLKTEILNKYQDEYGTSIRTNFLINVNKFSSLASKFPNLSNMILSNKLIRFFLHQFLGIHFKAKLPKISTYSFYEWFSSRKEKQIDNKKDKIVLFIDTFTNFYDPSIGKSTVKIIEALGYEVIINEQQQCCGRPAISKGKIELAKDMANKTTLSLLQYAEKNIPIIFIEPSCFSAIYDDYQSIINKKTQAIISSKSLLLEEFILDHEKNNPNSLNKIFSRKENQLAVHPHCHQKALGKGNISYELLDIIADQVYQIDSTCCGMAGSFGIEKEHYQISKDIANIGIIKELNKLKKNTIIITTGTSCKQQIFQHHDSQSMHLAEYLAENIRII
ncbi:MAG: FAD/FMN-containing dehydrogenase/Fe-S oxidoreductase [Chloroflexi bacterium]|jgi:FAD/FMN-containing dehydrogenase/Fe-S oxidoreductase|nr:MAG: FAD/FMN-containing dehydrogenase/Fe-S oxidoreductase [Chloroflexota bacterium]|tara:strand:+ start:9849 stop:12827 length:2979 start_codon:yes stop_codon:yes gene_type:complete